MTKHRLIPALIVALLLVLLAAPAGPVAAQDTPGAFIPAPCMFEGIELGPTTLDGAALGFECGYVVVPLRHAEPDGATIRLPVAVRRATAGAPDPLLLAQGGPGGDAFKVFSILVQPTGDLSTSRDIVIFNQRGTPYAEPELTCPETDAALADILAADSEEGERLYNEAMAACYDRLLAEGIDLSAFNSLENAADVPLIARALGYDEYNFYGVSYGRQCRAARRQLPERNRRQRRPRLWRGLRRLRRRPRLCRRLPQPGSSLLRPRRPVRPAPG